MDKEPQTPEEAKVRYWLNEMHEAKKREKNWRKEAKRIVTIYEAAKEEENSFNILYSNTETLAPALYSIAPRPRVVRRFRDEDPVGLEAAKIAQRSLEFFMDSADREYSEFDELMRQTVTEALVPGRGILRFKYDAKIDGGESVKVGGRVDDGTEEKYDESVSYETVCGEEVPWDRFLHGFAKKWTDVPWVAFLHFMDRAELEANFGKEVAENAIMTSSTDGGETGEQYDDEDNDESGQKNVTCVYEIWDKVHRKVIFICDGYKEKPAREADDPLQLQGFYPCPKPLTFARKINTLVPTPVYMFYHQQAKELNRLTQRINRLIEACKIRGIYDGTIQEVEELMKQDDNTLMPATNVAAMQDGKNLENSIWLMPIDKLIVVIRELYQSREQIRRVIYEITGISDILRGSSVASESATAQRIKNEWGNLRLRRWQREVQRYARDCLRIMAEIAVTRLDQKTFMQMTGLNYPTEQEKQQLTMQMQQMQMQQMQQPPEMDPNGQPVPPQPDPEMQQMEARSNMPSWEQLLGLLKSDALRSYKVDIETNSTLDADVSEDKENMTEFVNSLSQFLLAVQPLVERGSMPFDAAKAMLLQMSRRFNFGAEVEDELKKMQEGEPNDPEADKAQQEVEQAKQELEIERMKFEQEKEIQQMELEMERKKMELEMQYMQREMQLEMQYRQKEQQLQADKYLNSIQGQLKQVKDTTQREVSRVESGQKAFQNVVKMSDEGNAKLVQSVTTMQQEMREAMQALAGVVQALTQAQSAPRRIRDGQGREFTVESLINQQQQQ